MEKHIEKSMNNEMESRIDAVVRGGLPLITLNPKLMVLGGLGFTMYWSGASARRF